MNEFDVIIGALTRLEKNFEVNTESDGVKSVSCLSGYIGFCVSMEFDVDGNLIDIGAYE